MPAPPPIPRDFFGAPFSISGAPPPNRELPAAFRDAARTAWEPMTSLLSRPRRISLTFGIISGGVGDFVTVETQRPAIIRLLPVQVGTQGAGGSSAGNLGMEVVPGDTPTSDLVTYSGYSNTGRSVILPWGGRWNIRLTPYGATVLPTAIAMTAILQEATPGTTAADLIAIRGIGRAVWAPLSVVTADTNPHTLWATDPNRTYLLLQNTGGINMYVTLDGSTPSATNGITMPPLGQVGSIVQWDGEDTPLDTLTVVASAATAGRVGGYVAHG